jgi:hypothetical protein
MWGAGVGLLLRVGLECGEALEDAADDALQGSPWDALVG